MRSLYEGALYSPEDMANEMMPQKNKVDAATNNSYLAKSFLVIF